jgi:transcriptional regulator with XRE-family HTH domain
MAAKLTLDRANEIRRRYELGGITQRGLASEYGVSVAAINSIVLGRSWKAGNPRAIRKSHKHLRFDMRANSQDKENIAHLAKITGKTEADAVRFAIELALGLEIS